MSERDRRATMFDLCDSVRVEIRDRADDLALETYPDDLVREIAESWVPVMNYDLLMLAVDDLWLAVSEPDILGFDGESTAVNAIAGNVYERLVEVADEEWKAIEDERDDEEGTG